jgi:hypothetical protein
MKLPVLSAYSFQQLRLRALWLFVIGCGVLSLSIQFGAQLLMGRRDALDPSFS